MTLIPRRLKRGDTIGIVSPSSPVTQDLRANLDRGIAFLESVGLRTKLSEHVFSTTLGYAAAPEEKAADINAMFADDSIDGIMCSQGGATANGCLPYLDWNGLRQNPKVFMGMSDICVLLNAIWRKTGMVTFHGGDVMWGFGRDPSPYDKEEFVSRLVEGRIGRVNPADERRAVRGGIAKGTLLGGNIHALLKLLGTPYFPDLDDAILLVEALRVRPDDCDSLFRQLEQMGVFESIGGVIVGYILGLQGEAGATQMEEVLLDVTREYDFPILKTNDFGHNCSNTVLPVGARVRMDADEKSIKIVEEVAA